MRGRGVFLFFTFSFLARAASHEVRAVRSENNALSLEATEGLDLGESDNGRVRVEVDDLDSREVSVDHLGTQEVLHRGTTKTCPEEGIPTPPELLQQGAPQEAVEEQSKICLESGCEFCWRSRKCEVSCEFDRPRVKEELWSGKNVRVILGRRTESADTYVLRNSGPVADHPADLKAFYDKWKAGVDKMYHVARPEEMYPDPDPTIDDVADVLEGLAEGKTADVMLCVEALRFSEGVQDVDNHCPAAFLRKAIQYSTVPLRPEDPDLYHADLRCTKVRGPKDIVHGAMDIEYSVTTLSPMPLCCLAPSPICEVHHDIQGYPPTDGRGEDYKFHNDFDRIRRLLPINAEAHEKFVHRIQNAVVAGALRARGDEGGGLSGATFFKTAKENSRETFFIKTLVEHERVRLMKMLKDDGLFNEYKCHSLINKIIGYYSLDIGNGALEGKGLDYIMMEDAKHGVSDNKGKCAITEYDLKGRSRKQSTRAKLWQAVKKNGDFRLKPGYYRAELKGGAARTVTSVFSSAASSCSTPSQECCSRCRDMFDYDIHGGEKTGDSCIIGGTDLEAGDPRIGNAWCALPRGCEGFEGEGFSDKKGYEWGFCDRLGEGNRLYLSGEQCDDLQLRIRQATKFLKKFQIIDYSLLVTIRQGEGCEAPPNCEYENGCYQGTGVPGLSGGNYWVTINIIDVLQHNSPIKVTESMLFFGKFFWYRRKIKDFIRKICPGTGKPAPKLRDDMCYSKEDQLSSRDDDSGEAAELDDAAEDQGYDKWTEAALKKELIKRGEVPQATKAQMIKQLEEKDQYDAQQILGVADSDGGAGQFMNIGGPDLINMVVNTGDGQLHENQFRPFAREL